MSVKEEHPRIAVVGHPNKGKSSIVATLAHDDSVSISANPGTTKLCRDYPMKVNGEVIYVLTDTPGFQRARRALDWMKKREESVADRESIVRDFVEYDLVKKEFPDEWELLRPIVSGAGILYVVDGSVPYSDEYEAELEILRWSGRPRMALINPITSSDYAEQWRVALGQYFSVVREFNAHTANFQKQIELLNTFAELDETWREPLAQAADILIADRRQNQELIAANIADTIVDMVTLKIEQTISESDSALASKRNEIVRRYEDKLKSIERTSRDKVEKLLGLNEIERKEIALDVLDPENLLTKQSWRLFGLSKQEVVKYSAFAGAATGAVLDTLSGGASLLMGSVVGGTLGAIGSWFAADSLVDARILMQPLGRRLLVAGPSNNINLPHVVFRRARLHYNILSRRTHACRELVDLTNPQVFSLRELNDKENTELERLFARVRKGRADIELSVELTKLVHQILRNDQ